MAKTIPISGHIGFEVTVSDIRKQLNEANGEDVIAEINSPGGFVYVGIEIFNLFRDYVGHTTAKIMSLAASMGSYIPLAFDKTIAHDNTVFMIHNAGSVAIGNHNVMRKTADYLESISDMLASEYVKAMDLTLAEVKKKMDDETYYFGKEILDAGFVDEIIEAPDKDKNKDKASAVTEGKLMVEAVFARMKESSEAEADISQAAAYLVEHSDSNNDEISDIDKLWMPIDSHNIIIYDKLSALYDKAKKSNPEAPFPNEHACRIRDPKDFKQDSFRRIRSSGEGKKFDIIIGKLKGKTTTTTQAFRYAKNTWTASEAKKHCKDHDGILFEPATGSGNNINNCPNCGKNSKEENRMNLKKLLQENPDAQTDFDKAVGEAKKAGAEEVQATIKKVVPIMTSDVYPKAIKDLGAKVLIGEADMAGLTAVVTMKDAEIEEAAAVAAAKENGKETPGGQGGQGGQEDGSIQNAEDFSAAEAAHNKGNK